MYGKRFRHQLAKYNVQGGNYGKAHHKGQCVLKLRRQFKQGKYRRQHFGNGRFANPAKTERGKGNAKLRYGKVGVKVFRYLSCVNRAFAAFFN